MVEDRVTLDRRDHSDRDTHEDAEDVRHADDREGIREALRDEIADRGVAHERDAEVSAEHRGHPLDVSDRPGLIQAQALPDPLADLRRDPRIGAELGEGVDRSERQDRVDHKTDDDQCRDRDEETARDVATHR